MPLIDNYISKVSKKLRSKSTKDNFSKKRFIKNNCIRDPILGNKLKGIPKKSKYHSYDEDDDGIYNI